MRVLYASWITGFYVAGVFLCAGLAALGGYLRALGGRRRVAIAATQRAERLAMAAGLHDFVAHHVTGILLQARMAQMIRTTDPEQHGNLLEGVVHGATEALASMRRTVGFLRDSLDETAAGKAAAERRVGTLGSLPELVVGFGGQVGPKAVLHRDASVFLTTCPTTSKSPPTASCKSSFPTAGSPPDCYLGRRHPQPCGTGVTGVPPAAVAAV